jgi:hypothetical protein
MDVSIVKYQRVQDTSTYDETGKRTKIRRYTVYIGGHGPFTIDVPLEPTFDAGAIDREVQALQAHLAPR